MSRPHRTKVRVVTAYVPIEGHTRSAAEYEKLGERLVGALGDFKPIVFFHKIPDLWMTPFVEKLAQSGHHIRHSQGDNPAKNSIEYHAVQHQKFEWLEKASLLDSEADVFVWLDFGCMRLPGFDSIVLANFLRRVKGDQLAIPGCWPMLDVDDARPCWRFCGTMFVVPRRDVMHLNQAFQAVTRIRVRTTRNVTWEVNDLAIMELMKVGPTPRWYKADHNASLLTGY